MKQINLKLIRRLILFCSPLVGIAMCFIRWQPKPNYVASGWPVPWATWEKIVVSGKESWIDYPGFAGLLINPLLYFIAGLVIYWIIGRFAKQKA